MAAILEAAAQVFEAHGYPAATTNRIAERAGVSIGSLYQYFADKDAVFLAVAEAHLAHAAVIMAPLIDQLDQTPPPDPRSLLAEFFQTMLALHGDRPRLHRFILEGGAPAFQAAVDTFEEALTAQVAAYLVRLPDPIPHPEVTARLLVQTVDALSHRWIAYPADEADDIFIDAATSLLAARLESRPTKLRRTQTLRSPRKTDTTNANAGTSSGTKRPTRAREPSS